MFRGSADAKIDEKGRLKLPSKFRSTLLEKLGPKIFITAYGSPSMKIFPLSEWIQTEEILRGSGWGDDPKVVQFLRTVDLYGDEQELDPQGRILVPQRLRKHARMDGEVVVLGYPTNYLEVWNEQVLLDLQAKEPLTDETIRFVSGILREAKHGGGQSARSGHARAGDPVPPGE